MPEYSRWWANRVGQLGAATVTATQPEPLYGAAVDLGSARTNPLTYEDMLNAITTMTGEENAEAILQQIMQQSAAQPEQPEQGEEDEGGLISSLYGNSPIGDAVFGAAGSGIKSLWNSISGTDEETGLNRTERKWLESQANQDTDISYQMDADLEPELGPAARDALEGGEWTPELISAYQRYQGGNVENRVMAPFEWIEENVYQRVIAPGLSTGLQVLGTEFQDYDEASPLEGETWREAWDRANNISPGQALTDPSRLIGLGEERLEAYREGFDEFGNPVNQAYEELREDSATYNAFSGATDFAVRWYLDPLVVAGKAAGTTRALVKGDWNRMPKRMRGRVMHIVSTPAERWDEVRAGISPLDPVGQRAIKMREEIYKLRDDVRSAPDSWDAVRLAEEVPALKGDLLASGMFRELSLFERTRWDSAKSATVTARTLEGARVYDDSLFETGVAAMMGNGKARAELAARKELDDFFYYTSTDEALLLQRDMAKLKQLEYMESRLFAMELRQGRRLTAKERYSRIHAARESIAEKADRALELKAQLAQYDKYNRFMNATLGAADSTWLRYGKFKPKERKYNRITHRVLKPGGASGVTTTVTYVPRAAWLGRSNAIDLSGHSSLQTQAPRIMDEVASAVNDLDTLNAFAQGRNAESWNDLRRTLLNRAASARNDIERGHAARAIEDVALEAVAAKHELTADQALEIVSKIRGRQGEIYADMRKQAMDAKAKGFSEHDIRRYTYAEGSNLYEIDAPVPLTQLENYHVPVSAKDLDRFLTHYGEAIKNTMRSRAYSGLDAATDLLDIFNTFWKVGVLFRFGYPIRTVSEETLRILAHTGSFQHLLQDMPKAIGVGMQNTGKRVANFAMRHSPKAARWRGAQLSYTDHQGHTAERVRIGPGYEFENSFAPGSGDIWSSLNSADSSVQRLFRSGQEDMYQLRRGHYRTHRTMEGEEGHAFAWADVLNNQVRYDPIFQKMLHGETNDEIVDWLKRHPDGREAVARNPVRGADPEKWVDQYRAELDELVPDDVDDLRVMLANNQEISVEKLQTVIDDTGRHSPVSIDSAALELVMGRGKFAEAVYKGVENGYHLLAALPTNVLARNPFFDRQYRHFLQRLVDDLPDNYGPLSNAQQRAFENQARHFALAQVKRYLFNTVDNDTDLIRQFRFLSPFMGAWKETMKAWGRVVTENPESFQRLYVNGWESMGDLFRVDEVDNDGRGADDPLHGELDRLQIAVPKEMVKTLGYLVPFDTGKQFRDTVSELADEDGAVRVGVTKQTLNTTLQGDPFWLPSGGPIVQIAAKQAIGEMPELADQGKAEAFLYKYLFPIGVPDDAADAILPTLARRVRRFADGMNDPVFSNSATLLYKAEMYKWEQAGRPPGMKPDKVEVVEKAKAIQAAYIVGAIGSPFSFELQSDMQFFVDRAHQYQDEFGFEEGYKRFIEDFGDDAYYFWYSNSKNNVGVPATSEGWKMTKKHRDLIAKYPNIGLAIVGMNTQDSPFNYNVWALQARSETYPGSGTLMRERRSPEEAVAYAEAQEGWQEWRELSTAIDAELMARDITDIVNGEIVPGNIQRKEAQDLQYLKAQYREYLRRKYPGWSDAYDKIDKGGSYAIVDEFRGVLRDGMMLGRVEWEGVAEYMELHDAVAAELDARAAQGGSPNIENEANADLYQIFTANVAAIVQNNLAFADVYHRFLERHLPTNGSNGAEIGFGG